MVPGADRAPRNHEDGAVAAGLEDPMAGSARERIFKPRLASLTGKTAARFIGLACFFLSLIVAIPIPLLHHAPAASVALFGLALIYRDGALVIAAIVASIASIVIDALVIGSGVVALVYMASRLGL